MKTKTQKRNKKKNRKKEIKREHTTITSVSLSKEFDALMDEHGISPTEACRIGVAVMLFEKGISPYVNPLNLKRYGVVKELMLMEHFKNLPQELLQAEGLLGKIRATLGSIK